MQISQRDVGAKTVGACRSPSQRLSLSCARCSHRASRPKFVKAKTMAHPVSPLSPKSYPELPEIAGVRFATAEAGIKYKNRTDVLLAAFEPGTTVAGVFTSSKCPSAPVDWCRQNLKNGVARGLLVNSGNANAFTGMKGRHTVEVSAGYAA